MRRLSVLIAIVASLVLASTLLAADSTPKLSFVKDGGASIGWSTEGGSSPAGGNSNANNQSIRINSPATFTGGASAYTYGAAEDLVGIRGLTLSQITHLGFDSKGFLGAGAPRISLGTLGTDGAHTYFLSAFYCNDVLTNGWRTSDFPNDATACTIWRDGTTELTWTAAEAIADANHETVVANPNDWFLIVDEGPSVTYVDRLTVENWMWTGNGNNGIINCNSGDCV
jgi:hypothetical protein